MKKIPTGISDLDAIIEGGVPAGSVVLLFTEIGAGGLEYLYTSSAKLLRAKNKPEDAPTVLGDECKDSKLPGDIHYITFSRAREDILEEVKTSFDEHYYETIEESVNFKDLSKEYFQRTMVPPGWSGDGEDNLFSDKSDTDLLESLVDFLEENAEGNMVVIDSLTDLLTNSSIDNDKLVTIIKGMRRASKKWGGVAYLLLSKDIVDEGLEYHIIDSVDGVFSFKWSDNPRVSQRQRYLIVDKFMSVLPHLKRQKIARFTAEVTDYEGYVVINYERII
ncbi:MAG: recombinase RecA [Candidatus Thermoplasmatota archaeon]|nr:recombinase RecA [Candidatus Thermoplasmatota archaeon]